MHGTGDQKERLHNLSMIPESTVLGLTLFSRLSVLILSENRRQMAGRGLDGEGMRGQKGKRERG